MPRPLSIRCLPLALVLCAVLPWASPAALAKDEQPAAAAAEDRLTSGRAGAVLRALDRHVRAQGETVRIEELDIGVLGIELRGTAATRAAVDTLARAVAADGEVLAYLARDAVEPRTWHKRVGDGTLRMSINVRSAMDWERGLAAGARPLGVDAGLDRVAALARKAGLDVEPPHVRFGRPYGDGSVRVSTELTLRTPVARTGVLGLGQAERVFFDLLDADPALRGALHKGDLRVFWQLPKDETNSALRSGSWEAGPVIEALRRHAAAMDDRVRLLGFSTHLGIRVTVDVSSELALTDLRKRLRTDPAVKAFLGKLRVRDVLRSYEMERDGRARAEVALVGNVQPYIPGSGLTQATDSKTALTRIGALAARAGVEPGGLAIEHAYEFRDGQIYANTWIPVASIGAAEMKLLTLIANDPALCAPDAHWAEEPTTELRYKGSKPGNGIAVLWRLDAEAAAAFRAKGN